jgi:hypothetical protein
LKHIHSFSVTVYYFIELYKTFPNCAGVEASSNIGVNYGVLGNNLPSPYRSIELLTTMKAGRVKIYDANPDILRLLSTTNLKVSIMIPNHEISGIAANQSIADEWVRNNIFPYYQKTLIRYLLVGNEVLSYNSEQGHKMWHDLVPAMRNIKRALNSQKIGGIKIGTPLAISHGCLRINLPTIKRDIPIRLKRQCDHSDPT